MKSYETKDIRNVAVAGHAGAGKTLLLEAILFAQKQTERMGTIEAGTTVSDYDPEEARRQHSISVSLLPADFKGAKINFMDLPGRRDFLGHSRNAIRIADAVLFVIDATHGPDVGAEFAAEDADEMGVLARAAFVNKMDKERAKFDEHLEALGAAVGRRPVPVAIPVGAEANFKGVIDLIRMKFIEEKDRAAAEKEIPAELSEAAQTARSAMIEAAAEGDEELMAKFLDDQPLTDDEILKGLKEGMIEGRILPVACGSAATGKGIATLLNLIRDAFPNPIEGPGLEAQINGGAPERVKVAEAGGPLAFIFKTVSDPYAGHLSFFKVIRGKVKSESHLANMRTGKSERLAHVLTVLGKKHENSDGIGAGDIGAVAKLDTTHTYDTLSGEPNSKIVFTPTRMPKPTVRMAVVGTGKADEDKVGIGLHRLIEQDPTLHVNRDDAVHQTILSGMGDTHLDVAVHLLKQNSQVEVKLEVPRVAYRETITKAAQGQGKYKKQSGGRGQYGDCHIKFEPLPEGGGFKFEWAVVGGVVPSKYESAITKGLEEAMHRGVLSGHPTVDVKATCYDGSYHDVDSSDMAFKVAASMAFKQVIPEARPIILEPVYKAKITIPEKYMGDVMGNLNGRRGRILNTSANGRRQVIEALAPLAEMFTYSRDLRSITHGAGYFEMDFDHYQRTPAEVQEKIVAEAAKNKQEVAEH